MQHKRPMLTVIVPMYNVEKYIGACLESLTSQQNASIEIICINDGSLDLSYDIAYNFSKKHNNISIISIPNSGLSIARNTGLHYSNGEYVIFVDGDDLIKENSLADLIQKIIESDLDVVYFNSHTIYESANLMASRNGLKEAGQREHLYKGIFTGAELGLKFFENDEYTPSACMAIYKKSFLKKFNIQFIPGIIHEDNFFTYEALLNSTKTAHTPKELYIRLIRSGSIMTSINSARSFIGYGITQYEILKSLPKIKNADQIKFTELLINQYSILCSNLISTDDTLRDCFLLAPKIGDISQRIYINHLLNSRQNLSIEYKKGLNDATIALANQNSIDKRATAPCVSNIDSIEIKKVLDKSNRGLTRITLVGWMLLWGKVSPGSVIILIDSKHSESPIAYEKMNRPDVLKHHVQGQSMCGFKATFETTRQFTQILLKGYWQDNVVSESIELKLDQAL